MKRTVRWLVALLALGCFGAAGQANPYFPNCPPTPTAPDACGHGYYCTNPYGGVYGPNYCVYPHFPPFNGPMYTPPCPANTAGAGGPPGGQFPTHPYARSPRDYFMVPTP
jgi:hypothetical protein